MKFMRSLLCLLTSIFLTACTSTRTADPTPPAPTLIASFTETASANACPLTEPTWAKFPEDSAVQDPPAYGYYFINEDSSIWASAWWTEQEENYCVRVKTSKWAGSGQPGLNWRLPVNVWMDKLRRLSFTLPAVTQPAFKLQGWAFQHRAARK